MTVLISTIHEGTRVIQAIKSFKPSKIYFLVDEPIYENRKISLKMVKEFFSDIEYEEISVKIYDIVDIASKALKVIRKEEGQKIILHISEGRRTMCFGLLFAASIVKNKVDSAHYIIEETNSVIQIPILKLAVSAKKKKILDMLNKNIHRVSYMCEELGISSSTLYVHLKELRDNGFLTKRNRLTEVGKIVLL